MRKKLIIAAIAFVLILLTVIQITIDYCQEIKIKNDTTEVTKKTEYIIFIEIEDKTLYLLQDNKCIRKYPIASGASGWPSPLGSWKVVTKGDWGEGFGGRWMGLDVPWGTY